MVFLIQTELRCTVNRTLDTLVSGSYNSVFKGLPVRLFPFHLYFSIIFGIVFILVILLTHFDLYLLVFLLIFPLTLALDLGGKPDIYVCGTSQNFKHGKK